jgi:hypothetical protein
VRNDRYKLIENLLPGQVNPGYDFTNGRFEGVLPAIEAAPDVVREAYHRMHGLRASNSTICRSDPYEFRNLAGSEEHSGGLRGSQAASCYVARADKGSAPGSARTLSVSRRKSIP